MSKFLTDIITGTSNQSYEISRVLALGGVASFIIYGGFDLFVNKRYSPAEYGGGFGAILLGAGFGTAAKDRAHPSNRVQPAPTIVEGDLNTTGSGDIKPGGGA